MTTLKERLHADVVSHMKDRNKVALTTVRNVLGEIETREKSGKTPIELDDAQVTALLQKEAAKRRDTARIYTEAGESGRAAAEIAEAEVIEAYLPKPLTAAEVETIVDEAIASLKADGVELSQRQLGAVMKPVTAQVAGRFDGKAVSEIVRRRLGEQGA
ncbi:GatB/YqeY domain-containing protein [Arthrobacter sp. PM3]|uniref:GatB/YqeY domain-containing protein n=1 Tax=Arthrobacter sp. PM3 TaxID=2017685 RepID=UPI000E103BD0|nr:GatB/YqeY domain-containing protein [Arthrobacter sp. PM3]AXJ08200.1 glutamyl-tRNA amidotransferase [Arthrobacter sp. PM3]